MRRASGLSDRHPLRLPGAPPWGWTAAALVLALAACAGEKSAPQPVYDLGDNLAFARVTRETAEVIVGSPGDEAHILSGWSHQENETRSGRSFRWGLEPQSDLTFVVLEPRAVTLRLEGRPRRGSADSPPAVEVAINGQPAGRLALRSGRHSYVVELTAEQLRRGDNQLRLSYDLDGPEAVLPGEERAIAVAWYKLDLEGLQRTATDPRLDPERGLLFIPHGSQIDYYLSAPANAVLRSTRRRFVGGEGLLTVYLGSDGTADRRLASVTGDGELEVSLPAATADACAIVARRRGHRDRLAQGAGGRSRRAPAVWTECAVQSPCRTDARRR